MCKVARPERFRHRRRIGVSWCSFGAVNVTSEFGSVCVANVGVRGIFLSCRRPLICQRSPKGPSFQNRTAGGGAVAAAARRTTLETSHRGRFADGLKKIDPLCRQHAPGQLVCAAGLRDALLVCFAQPGQLVCAAGLRDALLACWSAGLGQLVCAVVQLTLNRLMQTVFSWKLDSPAVERALDYWSRDYWSRDYWSHR